MIREFTIQPHKTSIRIHVIHTPKQNGKNVDTVTSLEISWNNELTSIALDRDSARELIYALEEGLKL